MFTDYNKLSRAEKLALTSLFPEKALKDKDWKIRRGAYRVLGHTEGALKDEHWLIRRDAYRTLGFTKEALKDESYEIRQEARIYFNYIKSQINLDSL